MAADETLQFNIFARLREDGFAKAAKAATATSEEVKHLSDRLAKLDKQSAEARVALKGDKEAIAALDKLDLKLVTVGNRVSAPEVTLHGAARTQAELSALEISLSKLGSTSEKTTASVGSGAGGLAGPGGMGALIAAGVALSPIIATVAVGVAGFGAAAAGAVAPVLKAAQATGGLRANMASLNPEQQKLAKSLLGLGKQYDAFQKSLQPEVLTVFGKGIRIAGHLMHDVQPIAAATGKALGGMLDAIDAEFKSGTWQRFFGFMAANVGPDIQLVTKNFTDLMELLPGLLMDLQPVGTALLTISDNLLKVAAAATKGFGGLTSVNNAASDTPKHANAGSQAWHFWEKAVRGAEDATAALFSVIPGLNNQTGKTATNVKAVGTAAAGATQPVFNMSAAVKDLTDSMTKNIDVVLTLQGDQVAWQQSMQAATKQLNSNSAGLRGNSKDALANKAAVIQNTQEAVKFADDQLTLGHNLNAASGRIQDQIHWLQVHGGKSKFARDEIHALRMEEDKLRATIDQKLEVSASGFWKVTGALQGGGRQSGPGPHPTGAARGAFIRTGQPGVDDQLIMAQRGELVVPTAIVKAGLTDHLRGMIPGFASGGVVSSYSGSVGGMPPWLAKEDAATLHAVEAATAAATAAALKTAGGSFMGGGGSKLVRYLRQFVGRVPYVWGGTSPSGWDCSGMVEYGLKHALGISSPRTSEQQFAWVRRSKDQAGALVFFVGAGGPPPGHVGISLGNGAMINAAGTLTGTSYGHTAGNMGFGVPPMAQGGVVGDAKPRRHVSAQQQRWLNQLAGDVKRLDADQDHAAKRRKLLNRGLAIDELWFLTHPGVKKGGIGWNEHEKALSRDRRLLRHFNKSEREKEAVLGRKIQLLRLLTHFPKGKMYGGPGVPAPDPGAGDGGGDTGGGDTGGGTTSAPSGPPPIPPPPMPAWMVAAGLGGSAATATGGFTFPGQTFQQSGMAMPEPVAPRYYGGTRSMGGYGGSGMDFGAVIAEIRAMHQGIVGAVGMVAPGTARGFDRSMTGMSARVAGRFT